jgi:hypothetical protein
MVFASALALETFLVRLGKVTAAAAHPAPRFFEIFGFLW